MQWIKVENSIEYISSVYKFKIYGLLLYFDFDNFRRVYFTKLFIELFEHLRETGSIDRLINHLTRVTRLIDSTNLTSCDFENFWWLSNEPPSGITSCCFLENFAFNRGRLSSRSTPSRIRNTFVDKWIWILLIRNELIKIQYDFFRLLENEDSNIRTFWKQFKEG